MFSVVGGPRSELGPHCGAHALEWTVGAGGGQGLLALASEDREGSWTGVGLRDVGRDEAWLSEGRVT